MGCTLHCIYSPCPPQPRPLTGMYHVCVANSIAVSALILSVVHTDLPLCGAVDELGLIRGFYKLRPVSLVGIRMYVYTCACVCVRVCLCVCVWYVCGMCVVCVCPYAYFTQSIHTVYTHTHTHTHLSLVFCTSIV